MHYNEMINIKLRYEIIYNARLDDEVMQDGKNQTLEKQLDVQED